MTASDATAETRTVAATITGRVQGVSYRMWARETAERLGLSGSVRNRDDGAVEAVFSGPAAAVERMIGLCRSGPAGARVADVAVTEGVPPPRPGFAILRG
ncbi:acylphosphatase [Methylobacterium sp. NEAU 140]|uniref:acylphosphatase n=1 Tax=Methylobacterium sp. NEAU 140 TaxID=3064945 RepID=UPI002737690F|nr:acylphosphatase [Methylobacterium sp. NEAU 140]MDP4026174.1 acylphosphatase [Methylobacterium sp. NEAU 140]